MRRTFAAVAVAVASWAAAAQAGIVNNFNDILFWNGSGTNSASLVLHFPTALDSGTATPTSIAWGYHWNGSATFADMLFSLAGGITGGPTPAAGSDPRLSVDVTNYGSSDLPDYFVNTLTYNQVGLPLEWSQVVRVIGPYNPDTGEYPAQYQLDSAGGSWLATTPFGLSGKGVSTTPLVDGGWYGFVQADGSASTYAFTQPVAAIPEPSGMALAACGFMALGMCMRRRDWRGTLRNWPAESRASRAPP